MTKRVPVVWRLIRPPSQNPSPSRRCRPSPLCPPIPHYLPSLPYRHHPHYLPNRRYPQSQTCQRTANNERRLGLVQLNPAVLRTLRETSGLSQSELSRETGLSQGHISAMERGTTEPGLPTIKKLADALRVPLSALCAPVAEGNGVHRSDSDVSEELAVNDMAVLRVIEVAGDDGIPAATLGRLFGLSDPDVTAVCRRLWGMELIVSKVAYVARPSPLPAPEPESPRLRHAAEPWM